MIVPGREVRKGFLEEVIFQSGFEKLKKNSQENQMGEDAKEIQIDAKVYKDKTV